MTPKPLMSPAESGQVVGGVQSEMVLADRVLQDGEQIILMVKPSAWFILLRSARTLGLLAILTLIGTTIVSAGFSTLVLSLAVSLATLLLLWASYRWLGRLYVLTDRRILRIDGLMHPTCCSCLLGDIQEVIETTISGERLLRLGSLGFSGQRLCPACWIHINDPTGVAAEVRRAISVYGRRNPEKS